MTFLTELDVVNDMLATMGETSLNTLEDAHPLVPAGRRFLKERSWQEQAKSWWFNRELTTLNPDPAGMIFLPADTISVDPFDVSLSYVQRGDRLYKPFDTDSNNKFIFTEAVTCWLVRNLPFTDLPGPAQRVISVAARLDFQLLYDADTAKVALLRADLQDAYITLNTEHIRNKGVNLLNRANVVGTMNFIMPRPRVR